MDAKLLGTVYKIFEEIKVEIKAAIENTKFDVKSR